MEINQTLAFGFLCRYNDLLLLHGCVSEPLSLLAGACEETMIAELGAGPAVCSLLERRLAEAIKALSNERDSLALCFSPLEVAILANGARFLLDRNNGIQDELDSRTGCSAEEFSEFINALRNVHHIGERSASGTGESLRC